jgi:hypothetical protein
MVIIMKPESRGYNLEVALNFLNHIVNHIYLYFYDPHVSMAHHLMPCHISQLKNISINSRTMPHHLMPRYLSPLKNNSKNSRKSSHATSLSPLKNNSKYLLNFPILIVSVSIIFHLKSNLANFFNVSSSSYDI